MLKRVLVAVLVVAGLSSPASALRRVYVTNIGAGTVTVVDADRRTVLGVIEVGSEPDGVAVSPDGRSVYVANFADDTVSVIETATDSVVASIAVGDGPVGVAVSPDGAEVYVANRQAGTISIIDAAARTLVHEIPVSPLSGVNAVAFTPDGARALVTQSARDSVVIIDTATRRLVDGVRVGPAPSRIVVDPSGRRAYVSRFPNVLTSGFGSLVAIDLATLEVVVGPRIDRPTGLALSADARTVYVADTNQVLRVDAETLQVLGTYAAGSGLNGVIALGAPATVLVADTARDRLRFLPLMFGTEPQNPAPDTPVVTVPLEPFAIAAMPAREAEPLVASIDSPPFGFKLDVQSEVAVRITATAGELPLAEWTLVVRQDGVADQVLASGTAPASALDVVSLAGASFAPAAAGTLVLTVTAPDSSRVVRQASFTATDHRYALVPLRGVRLEGDPRPEMDGAGRRFTRIADSSEIELFDASTGITDFIRPRLSLYGTVLSRGGRRLGLFSPGSGTNLTGTFDLDSGLFSLVPYQFFLRFDLDAAGQWLTGLRLDLTFERYQLFDLFTGARRFISDVAGDTGGGAACGGNEDQRPRISADGSVVAFVTGLDLGVGPSTGCRLFAYDRPSETLRLVASLGDRYLQGPSLDDAG